MALSAPDNVVVSSNSKAGILRSEVSKNCLGEGTFTYVLLQPMAIPKLYLSWTLLLVGFVQCKMV